VVVIGENSEIMAELNSKRLIGWLASITVYGTAIKISLLPTKLRINFFEIFGS
jgi:hypothetical protein